MYKYVGRRLLQAIPIFFGITLLSYTLMVVAPGNPVARITFNPRMRVEEREAIAAQLGVNDPIHLQYLRWLAGDDWMRPALCEDALRLGRVLASLAPDEPEVHGLLALMEIQASRMAARTKPSGEPILLADQNRARWDRLLIRRGLSGLERALALGGARGPYTLQAAIAACHARAHTADETDWARIARLYLWLAEFNPSPVVDLNRAVAVAESEGAEAGLAIVEAIEGLDRYQPFHVARADLLRRIGEAQAADAAYLRAIELTANPVQRSFLERRRAELTR